MFSAQIIQYNYLSRFYSCFKQEYHNDGNTSLYITAKPAKTLLLGISYNLMIHYILQYT